MVLSRFLVVGLAFALLGLVPAASAVADGHGKPGLGAEAKGKIEEGAHATQAGAERIATGAEQGAQDTGELVQHGAKEAGSGAEKGVKGMNPA